MPTTSPFPPTLSALEPRRHAPCCALIRPLGWWENCFQNPPGADKWRWLHGPREQVQPERGYMRWDRKPEFRLGRTLQSSFRFAECLLNVPRRGARWLQKQAWRGPWFLRGWNYTKGGRRDLCLRPVVSMRKPLLCAGSVLGHRLPALPALCSGSSNWAPAVGGSGKRPEAGEEEPALLPSAWRGPEVAVLSPGALARLNGPPRVRAVPGLGGPLSPPFGLPAWEGCTACSGSPPRSLSVSVTSATSSWN